MRLPIPAAILAGGIALALVPVLELPAFYESFLYLVLHWVILATSWNILSGYSGYFSFGHGAFFGIGIYTTAVLAAKFDVPFLWTLPAAALVPALFGVGLGAVVFRVRRLRGELFALLTLAVTFVVATIVLNTPIDGGPGVYLSAVPLPQLTASPSSTLYLLVLIAAVAAVWIAYAVYRSKLGTGLFAIHDDEDVAEVMGVPTFRYKLRALALSCGLAGIAGGIHAMFIQYVTVGETFSITVPLTVVLMSVLGGTRHWLGPAVGATLITAMLYAFTAGDYTVLGRAVVGFVLIVVILFLPNGVLGQAIQWWQRRRRAHALPVAETRAAHKAHTAPTMPMKPPHIMQTDMPASSDAPAPTQTPALACMTTRASNGPTPAANLLECRGVTKSFRGVQALAGVDLDVREGEILGLVGPNGSGKSTMINVISGHYRLDAGTIRLGADEMSAREAHVIAGFGIARTYQIPRPFAHLSVRENVALPAMFGRAGLDRAAAEREAVRWMEFTGLADKADALPDEINLHQRKFLELARALASRPRLLLLDEVLSGLTPAEIDDAIRLIRAIRAQGTTIVFVEHVIRAVMELTDRIVVLSHGRVIAAGDPVEVMRQPDVVTAYLGKAHA